MKKIMIVEDEEALGNALKIKFESNGYEIVWAHDGDSALTMIDGSVSLIFLDIILPGMLDGFDLLKKIKAPEFSYRSIPVIMLTNQSDITQINKAVEDGAIDYIIKSSKKLGEIVEIAQKLIGNPE